MKKIVLSIFIVCVFVWECAQHWPVTIYVSGSLPEENFSIRMPLKDKKRLDYFFRNVCFLNTWAYTFMGSKPISINHYTKPWSAFKMASQYTFAHLTDFDSIPSFREICYLLNPVQLKLKRGLVTINKYIDFFPKSRFTILHDEYDNIIWFALVNKNELIHTVKSHLEDFQGILEEQGIRPEDLCKNDLLSKFVKRLQDDSIIGIVLGYGKNNARLYQKYRQMNLLEWPMESAWEKEDEARLKLLQEKELSFQSWDITDLFYPYFSCDPESEETKALKEVYRKDREKIVQYYEGKDVVEATFSLFNQIYFSTGSE